MTDETHALDATLRRAFVAYSVAYHLLALLGAVMFLLNGAPPAIAALVWCLAASFPTLFILLMGALLAASDKRADSPNTRGLHRDQDVSNFAVLRQQVVR